MKTSGFFLRAAFAVILPMSIAASAGFAQEFPMKDVRDPNMRIALRVYSKTNLFQLDNLVMNGSDISDIRPLSKLSQLSRLELYNNLISDIRPLTNLTGLKKLYLGKNRIKDISALKSVKSLEILDIHKNDIRDISPLAELPALKELDLREASVYLDSFSAWKFSDSLQIYDRNGKWFEVLADEKDQWGLYSGLIVPAAAPSAAPSAATNALNKTNN